MRLFAVQNSNAIAFFSLTKNVMKVATEIVKLFSISAQVYTQLYLQLNYPFYGNKKEWLGQSTTIEIP